MEKDDPSLSTMVFTCIVANSDLAKLLMERQAHLRLLRISVVNAVFSTITVVLFIQMRRPEPVALLTAIAVVAGTAIFSVLAYTWRNLYKYYITIVRTSYRIVRHRRDVR